MSTLMFWNKQNAANQNNETKNGKRNWLHAPDALLNGHVVYLVKYFGNTPVEQAKGIEVVKDAIRRLQFAQQMKKAETGNNSKTKKVEITVSVDGLAVQEPRTQKILHQFPLHNISYCADEKGVKKFFSFIAKTGHQPPLQNGTINNSTITTNGHTTEEGHECFVFISSKLASDITLTIGQAFDLAYRRFVNDNGKTTELSKVQAQNKQLERSLSIYRYRLKELIDIIPKSDLDRMLSRLGVRDIFEVPQENGIVENHLNSINGKTSESENSITNDDKLLIETSNKHFPPIIPPRNLQNQINNTLDALKPGGQKLDELLLNSDSDSDFDPRADENDNGNKITNDLFGFEPPKSFGQQLFTNNMNNNNINNNINNIINNANNNHNNNINSIINHNNNNNNLTNGINGMNGNVPPKSPPPLLAPPPKSAVPRRSAPTTNGCINNNNGSQDLFGSTPFNPNATTIFDAQFGSDTYKTTTNMNEIAFNMNGNLGNNSGGGGIFDDEIKNPFNESGIYDMNDTKLNNTINKLDSLLNTNNTSIQVTTSSMFLVNDNLKLSSPLLTMKQEKNNPFGDEKITPPQPNETPNKATKSIVNPFTKKGDIFLGPKPSNYDALRNSPEIEAMLSNNNNSNNNSTMMSSSSASTTPTTNGKNFKKESSPINYDIFKEAASAAFSELNNSGSFGNGTKHANEFSNKMAGLNFNAHCSSSFGSNNHQNNFNPTKQILVDDFSLESLDPLRK